MIKLVVTDENYINNLVDEFKKSRSEELKLTLLKEFEPYCNKYAYLLCSFKPMDLSNKDTIKFLRLFMSEEDRASDESLITAAKRTIIHLRHLFKDFTSEDLHNEMIAFFLEQLDRYKPMIANHKHDKPRISFTHFVQVNLRYRLKEMIVKRQRDAMQCLYVEYNDDLSPIEKDEVGINWNTIDLRWVHGMTTGDLFKQLNEMERYLLYLKYEDEERKPLSDYEIAKLTGMDRMYIRRKMLKIKDKLKELIETF